ncbi:MAG: DNA translocase FtsK [Treponema sp.]|nr:DNA translocase FtsK [Treponema sp.]
MFLKSFSIRQDHKYRLGSILGAVGLALIGIFLGFSITMSLFDLPFFFPGPGDFFIGAYGILAFMIPAYFFAAALILVDPVYRPDRIFILSAAVFPFLTLAVGLAIFRDYASHAERFRFMALLGKAGFTLGILLLTFLEIAVIRALSILLFPLTPKSPGANTAAAPGFTKRTFVMLPPPKSRTRRVYPKAAAKGDGVDNHESPPPALRQKRLQTSGTHKEAPKPSTWYDSSPASRKPAKKDPADTDKPENSVKALEIRRIAADRDSKEAESPKKSRRAVQFTEAPGGLEDREDAPERVEVQAPVNAGFPDMYDFSDIEELPDIEDFPDAQEFPALDSREAGDIPPEKDEESDDDFDVPEDGERGGEELPVPPSVPADAVARTALPVPAGEKKPGGTGGRKAARSKTYRIPVDGILNQYQDGQYWIIDQPTRDAAVILQKTLEEFGIQAEVTGIRKGPVITMFEILPAPGVKLSKIVNLQDNITLRLAASSVRIVAPIPGKHAVGIEVPNRKRNIVSFREIIEGELRNNAAREGKKDSRGPEIPVVLGKDITGEAQTVDLVQMPHLLIAGATGSGKSVCVNTMILSILYQRAPAECRLILIDPKIVELKLYNDVPHLLTPVITEPKRAFQALQYCLCEMERRYACLDSMGVRDIKSYNRRIRERNIAAEHIPYIVVVIDEFADLMATTGKELESTVARLAAMSRAVGIHLVLATQRPSIDVITGLIKANIPSRIAFMVASKMDSRIIIDMVGAEKLLGKGDMLYAGVVDPFPIRMQGAFVSEEEVERVVEYVKTLGQPDYIDDEIFFDEDDDDAPSLFAEGEDPLYDKALEIVVQQGKASASYIQRRLKIGYNRAARLVEEMETHGVVGPAQGSRPRELLRGV